jgi:RHS repeat-associated protein
LTCPDKARYKRIDTKISTNASTTTLYIGGVEKIYYPDGQIEWKRNIAGVGQITIKVDANGNEQSRTTHYFHKDHLGTTLTISDHLGNIVQELAYDPWGQRRTVSSPTPLDVNTLQSSYFKVAKPITQRGFTGHEMIDEVGVIHMNGRIYDAKIGRFMQADSVIQDPTSVASLNRYSYCWNNPLNATDPSGFVSTFNKIRHGWWIHEYWSKHAPIMHVVSQIGLAFIPGGGPYYAMAYGANQAYYASGGNESAGIKSFGISLAAMGAYNYIGHSMQWTEASKGAGVLGTKYTAGAFAGKVFAHAMVGGVTSVLQGVNLAMDLRRRA